MPNLPNSIPSPGQAGAIDATDQLIDFSDREVYGLSQLALERLIDAAYFNDEFVPLWYSLLMALDTEKHRRNQEIAELEALYGTI